MGIKLLPPDVNESDADFTVSGENIRFGLVAIKGIGWGFIEELKAERESGGPFRTLDEFCRRMLRALGRPIVSTSANISGEATPVGLQDVAREIIDGVDFVVNPRFEGKPTRKASSIIAFGEGGEVKIIRE